MTRFLVTFSANWSDEFDCEEFVVVNDSTLEEINAGIDDIILDEENYFGTNQSFYKGELTRDDFKVYELTKHEIAVFAKFFPTDRFGTGIL